MFSDIKRSIPFALTGAALLVLGGCVSNQELNEVRQLAEQALEEAQRANSCCIDTNQKIDRMFKRSMYK